MPESVYLTEMRDADTEMSLCWRLLDNGARACILERGHDNGLHEKPGDSDSDKPYAATTYDLIVFANDAEISARQSIPVRILHDGVYYSAVIIGKKGQTFQIATSKPLLRI